VISAKPINLQLNYNAASENVTVSFEVDNTLNLQPIAGASTIEQVTAKYVTLAGAIPPEAIKAAATAIGDDVITEYYYMDGTNKIYLRTTNNNDLIKNKYWSGYLVINGQGIPQWTGAVNTIIPANTLIQTSTNPMTQGNAVQSGWLKAVEGKDLHVKVTVIKNGNVNSIEKIVAIPTTAAQIPADAATMSNFNTHKGTDYRGVNVGWFLKDGFNFEDVASIKVELYTTTAGVDELLVTNTAVLGKHEALYGKGERQFSTPFGFATMTDEYWTFGDWVEDQAKKPTKAKLVITGLTGDAQTFVDDSLADVAGMEWDSMFPVANVSDLAGLKIALGNSEITTINIIGSFVATERIVVNRPVIINGGNNTITGSATDHGIEVLADNVNIMNLTVIGSGRSNINFYKTLGGVLTNVTLSNAGIAGLIVNGSEVIANNLVTSGNTYGGVNVDPGNGVTVTSKFTLNGGSLNELPAAIWSDGKYVTETAIVIVVAPGYTMQDLSDGLFIWTKDI
jgi:hypothetical protein